MDDWYRSTLDASLRSWELVHVATDQDGAEQGRTMFVSAAFARKYDLDLDNEKRIAMLFALCGGPLINLVPFQDMSLMGPRIGYE